MAHRNVIVQAGYAVGSDYSNSSAGSSPRSSPTPSSGTSRSSSGSPATQRPVFAHPKQSGKNVILDYNGRVVAQGVPSPGYSQVAQHQYPSRR
ncbi:hypothetical protein LIA77_11204 [Sarocladium implicatum]|nr:hypothetical protein LIA77_11204 [Sarocladium implicatum]